MADQHHGIPMSFSPSFDNNSPGQQQYAPAPYVEGSSGLYFQQQQHAPYATGASVPNPQGEGSSSGAKKVRGRPPGSRNKPKPPVFVTQEIDYPVKPAVIDVGGGTDVVEAAVLVARRRNAGIVVLHAAGIVDNVTLCHPLSQIAPFTVHGPFNLFGLSGSYLTPSAISGGFPPPSLPPFIPNLPPSAIHSSFGITLTTPQGCLFGGTVAGKVMAADQGVTMIALLFKNPEYHNIGGIEGYIVEGDIDNEDGGDGDHAGGAGTGGSAMHVSGPTLMGFGVPTTGSSGGGGLGASGSGIHGFGMAPSHASMSFSPVSMGFGVPASGGGGLAASGSGIHGFGQAPSPVSMSFSPVSMGFGPVSMGFGVPASGSGSGRDLGASGSGMPVFGSAPAPVSMGFSPVSMGFGVPVGGSGGGGLGASSSSMPVFSSSSMSAFSMGLAPAPMAYGVPDPNVMYWGHGQPGAHPPNY